MLVEIQCQATCRSFPCIEVARLKSAPTRSLIDDGTASSRTAPLFLLYTALMPPVSSTMVREVTAILIPADCFPRPQNNPPSSLALSLEWEASLAMPAQALYPA